MTTTKTSSSAGQQRRADRRERAIARDKQRRQRMMLAIGTTAILVAVLLIGASRFLQSNDAAAIDYANVPTNGMVVGSPDAPVTLVEYGDYQCIHCARFATDVEPDLMDDFIRSGILQYEFRPMPILGGDDLSSPDNRSVRAAEAAFCAADQDAFWPYHDRLMQATTRGAALDDGKLSDVAEEAGLNADQFQSCMDDRTHLDDVLASRTEGDEAGISSTPSFLLNGERITWSGDYEILRKQIELNAESAGSDARYAAFSPLLARRATVQR